MSASSSPAVQTSSVLEPLVLEPKYVEKVWGGRRLCPDREAKVGEAWVVHESNPVCQGIYQGRTLAEVARVEGARLLGRAVEGARFPLLIKLIDASESLSVQVHPNDAEAERLEGPGHLGKTEAWHILAADAGAKLVVGLKDGVSPDVFQAALGSPRVKDLLHQMEVHAGETLFVAAGTVHAIGPGLLLYEVQQTSDITYRVYDWDRPMQAGRELHLRQSLEVAKLGLQSTPVPAPRDGNGVLTECPFFKLEMLSCVGAGLSLAPGGESFHALTVIDGRMTLRCGSFVGELGRYETVLVPASVTHYELLSMGGAARVLKASVR